MREKLIIDLLENCNSYLSLDIMAEKLHVSTRTILTDIKYLMNNSAHQGFEIFMKRGQGYYMRIHDRALYDEYKMKIKQSDVYHATDRISGIIALLLLQKDYITQDALAEKFHVSKSIIKADMTKVSMHLMEQHILIEKKAHYGIRIATRSLHRKEYMQQLYEEKNPYMVQRIEEVATADFKEVEKMMITLLKQYQLSTNYNELKKVDAFLKISIFTHKHELYEEVPFEESDSIYFQIAKDLGNFIEKIYKLSLKESELHDLGVYIQKKTKNVKVELIYNEQLKCLIEDFLIQADSDYHTKFNEDDQFKSSLLAHVSLLLDRLHQSISFANPLVKDISVKYPIIFNLAIKFTNELERNYHVHVTQDEIGFIATHFAAHMEKEARDKLSRFNRIAILCSSGGGSAFLIKLKLESLFTSSNIQTFSLMEQDEVNAFHPDVIFTITDLEETYDVPIIKINELLDDTDILKIKNMFGLSDEQPHENDVTAFFKKDCFYIVEDEVDYEQLLKMMAQHVEDSHYAEAGFMKYVMEREKFLMTIYNHGVAIPHPIEMCGIQNVISVAIIKSDIHFEEKQPKVIFMVSLKKTNMELHQLITRILFDVMSDEKYVEDLRGVASFEDFILKIKEQI